jgi:hypothetical protein
MYLAILILPLLGSVSSGLLGRKIGVTGSHLVTCSCLIISSILAGLAFYEIGISGSPVAIQLTGWIDSEFMNISWEFLFDQLTVSMFIPVLFISTLIHIFSTDYMSEDPHQQRFFSYLSLFTFFMLVLVAGGNYFVMFVGWEGIGVVSYLLINFWYTRIQANKAAILALTMNRVGDMGLSIGFFALFTIFGSLDYSIIFSLVPFISEDFITIIGILLLIGAMAKSAQIPLHSWLPGSMEGKKLPCFSFTLCLSEKLIIFIILLFYYLYFFNLELCSNLLVNSVPLLTTKAKQAIVGEMLGDGHLRFTKKDISGKGKKNTNVHFAMTLKNYDYIYYLWKEIYFCICTQTPIRPWPNIKSGKPATQYAFNSKTLPELTFLHSIWYTWSDSFKKYIKIVPLNIGHTLTSIGLAHWIMGDGYWSKHDNTLFLCTDNFTFLEVELLIKVLKDNFNLDSTIKRRIKSNKEIC